MSEILSKEQFEVALNDYIDECVLGEGGRVFRRHDTALRAALAAQTAECQSLTAQLTHWKTCANCGDQMDAPGQCSRALLEFKDGHAQMLEESLNERDRLTAQLTEAREARQRERERHEAKMIEVMNERDAARDSTDVALRQRDEANAMLLSAEASLYAAITEARGQVIAEIEAYLDKSDTPDSALVWAGPLRNKLTGLRMATKLATLDTRREGR